REAAQREGEGRAGVEGEEQEYADRQEQEADQQRVIPGQQRWRFPLPMAGNGAHATTRLRSTSRTAIAVRISVTSSITSESAAPNGQLAAFVKKSWIRLPYIPPLLPPTSSGVTYS